MTCQRRFTQVNAVRIRTQTGGWISLTTWLWQLAGKLYDRILTRVDVIRGGSDVFNGVAEDHINRLKVPE